MRYFVDSLRSLRSPGWKLPNFPLPCFNAYGSTSNSPAPSPHPHSRLSPSPRSTSCPFPPPSSSPSSSQTDKVFLFLFFSKQLNVCLFLFSSQIFRRRCPWTRNILTDVVTWKRFFFPLKFWEIWNNRRKAKKISRNIFPMTFAHLELCVKILSGFLNRIIIVLEEGFEATISSP